MIRRTEYMVLLRICELAHRISIAASVRERLLLRPILYHCRMSLSHRPAGHVCPVEAASSLGTRLPRALWDRSSL
jgi:hypothetical protein